MRDARISMIYEGTNSMQALDLLGHELLLDGEKLTLELGVAAMKSRDEVGSAAADFPRCVAGPSRAHARERAPCSSSRPTPSIADRERTS